MSKRTEDAAVAQAYLKRITGYDVTETKEEFKVNEAGELELTRRTETTKHFPGDARAAEFWLTNRQPKKWWYRRGAARKENGETGEAGAGIVELPAVLEAPEDGA